MWIARRKWQDKQSVFCISSGKFREILKRNPEEKVAEIAECEIVLIFYGCGKIFRVA